MVNRRRSAGFFLALFIPVLFSACSGKNSSEYAHSDAQSDEIADESPLAEPAATQNPIKMMLLGDSITQGDKNHRSYRYFLWKKLIDARVNVDLIGSMRENFNGSPEWPDYRGRKFDRDHEGHWGWKADEVLVEIDLWLEKNRPDVVLLHLGSNDMFYKNSQESTIDELTQVISRLRAANDQVILFVAELLPADRQNAELTSLNKKIVEMSEQLNSKESPIFIVDQNSGFSVSEDTYDGIHPDASGETKMADNWMRALLQSGIFSKN